MELKKNFVGGVMNKDLDARLVPEGHYINAENMIVSKTDDSSAGLGQKSSGFDKLTNIILPPDALVVGGVVDEGNECLYWFIASDNGNYIYEYNILDNNSLSLILADTRSSSENVLNFSKQHKITGVNIIYNSFNKEKLLVWTDDLNPIRCINVNRAKSYGENNFESKDISLYKRAPYKAPECVPTYSTDYVANNIEERFMSFAYRYKYLDGEYSAISAFSNPQFYPSKFRLDYSSQENLGMTNSFNAINIKYNTGDKNVSDIQLLFKENTSNNIYIIENINKKDEKNNFGDNVYKSFLFSNNKVYGILPSDEIGRLFDNIPPVAKAQEFIGNRLLFANYIEGNDLVDSNGKDIDMNFSVDFVDNEITANYLNVTLSTISGCGDNALNITIPKELLKKDNVLNINFRASSQAPFNGTYRPNLSFYMERDYVDSYDLYNSPEFILFINTIATNDFANSDLSNTLPPGETFEYGSYEIVSNTTQDLVIIKIPSITYQTSGVECYSVALESSSVFVSKGNAYSSCKSNMSYECGIVYLDEDGRYTSVLTDVGNSVFIPIYNSVSQNKLQLTIKSNPPAFADRYKVFVKTSKLDYDILYCIIAYREDDFLWLKLEGQSKQKVREGDYLIIKKDLGGVAGSVQKVQVLDTATKTSDFIEGNENKNGLIKEKDGYYMKIRATSSLNVSDDEITFIEKKTESRSTSTSFNLFIGPFSEKVNGTIVDYPITQGSIIDIRVQNTRAYRKQDDFDYIFEKSYVASSDYTDFESFFNLEGSGLGLFSDYEFVRGNVKTEIWGEQLLSPQANGLLYLRVKSIRGGDTRRRFGRMNGKTTITSGLSLLIFETDSKDNTSDVFYETQDTYPIVNGYHSSYSVDDTSQTASNDAVITLDWFNCYVMGNGAESYKVKDLFNKNHLSTESRPNATLIDGYKKRRNIASITYSGAFDKTTNYNSLNEFNLSRANYKDLDDKYGSIQKLHSRDTDLVVFQEDKVSRVLYGKSVLYDAAGNGQISKIEDVLGQEIPYSGEWGIGKNPESFSYYSNSLYFTDSTKGAVLRLGGDGIEPISRYGMRDWFSDKFRDFKTNFKYGGYDPKNNYYMLSFSNDKINLIGELQCSQTIEWLTIEPNSSYTYNIYLGSNLGTHSIDYNTGVGCVFDFDLTIDGVTTSAQNISGTGTFTAPKTSVINRGTFVITNNQETACSLMIKNNCIVTDELEVISLVVNDTSDTSLSMINGYYWNETITSKSGHNEVLDVFNASGTTRFEVISGNEGVGEIPLNGSNIKLHSVKATGEFTQCNRLGYLVSADTLDAQSLIDLATYPAIITDGDTNYINFVFNRNPGEKLYLVWDYIDTENCNVTPLQVDLCYHATDIVQACSCS